MLNQYYYCYVSSNILINIILVKVINSKLTSFHWLTTTTELLTKKNIKLKQQQSSKCYYYELIEKLQLFSLAQKGTSEHAASSSASSGRTDGPTLQPSAQRAKSSTLSASGAEPVMTKRTLPPRPSWMRLKTRRSQMLSFVMIPLPRAGTLIQTCTLKQLPCTHTNGELLFEQ